MPDNKFVPPSDAIASKKVESKSTFVPPSDAVEVKKKEPTVSLSGQNQESTTSVTPKVTEQKPLDSSSSKGEGIFEFKGRPGAIYKKKADGLWAIDVNNTGVFKDITDTKRIGVLEKQATPTFRTPEDRTAFEAAPKPEAKKELTREEKQVQKDFSKDFKVLAKTDPTVIAKNKEDNETYNLLNKIDSDVIASSEGEVVPKLKSMFRGTENDIFDFEETGAGYDAIKVTNRLTGKSQEFSLDNWSSGRDNDESKLLKGFLDVELKFKDQAYNQKRIQELEKLKENQLPIDAMQTQAQIDELRKDVDIDDKLKQNYAVNTGKYAAGAVYNKEAVNNTKAKFARANIDAVELKTQKANLDEWKKQADESLTSGSITQEEYDNVYMPKIVAEESDIRDKALNIQSSIDSLKRESGNLDVIAANHIMSQEDRGNFLTGTVKSFIKGVESPFLTIITQNMDNPAEAKRAILEATSPGIVTDEYLKSANRNDFESAVFGLAESIGSNLAGGPAGNASMFVSAYGNYKDELNATPGMENVPEYEKMLLSAGLAAPASIIEKFGIDKIMQKSPIGKKFTNWLLSKTISSLPKKASSEMLEKAIAENLKSAIARGIINVAADGAIEGFSEGAEQLVEGGTKELYDLMKGKDYFDNPKTVGGWLDNIGEAAKLGAIGGASVGAITQSLSVASDKRTAVDFNKIANAIEDDNLKDIIKTSLKAKVLSGEISKMKATEIMKNMESSETILKQIPSSLKPEDKYNAFNLIEEKSNLSKEIVGKDEALVSKQKERINAINEELKAISNKTEEYATKESEQPKQEVSTESNISERQGVESGQQEVGKTEGSERTTTQPEANISDSNIPGEEKVKVIAFGNTTGRNMLHSENYDDKYGEPSDPRMIGKDIENTFSESSNEDGSKTIDVTIPMSDSFGRSGGMTIRFVVPKGINVNSEDVAKNVFDMNKLLNIDAKKENVNDLTKMLSDAGVKFIENQKQVAQTKKEPTAVTPTAQVEQEENASELEINNIQNQIKDIRNTTYSKQEEDKKTAKEDIIKINNGDRSTIDKYVKNSGYKLITKDTAHPTKGKFPPDRIGDYYKMTGSSIITKTASQIAIDGANRRQNKKSSGLSTNAYENSQRAVLDFKNGKIDKKQLDEIILKDGLLPLQSTISVENVQEQAPKVKVEGKKARIDRAKAIAAETPHQMAAQYLLNGGKISRGVLEQLFGNKGGKPIKGEILSRLNIYDKNSDITIDGIAHKIWEDNGGIDSKYDTQEIREAVEDVIANSPQFDKAADLVIAESNKAQSKEIDYAEAMMQKANEDEQAFKNAFTDEENAKLAEEMAQAEFDFSKMDDNVNASDILEDIKSKDKFEEFLNNLIDKTSGKNTMFDASIGIPIAVINASLRAIKASYVVSRDMALAIKEGYKKLVEDGYDQMSEDQYTDMVAKNIARSNKNIKESVEYYKSRDFSDLEIEATLRRTGYSDAEISNAINAYNAPRENQGIDVEQEVQFPIVDENRIKEIDKLVKGEENIDKIVSKGIDNNFTDDEVREYLKAKKNLSDKDASEAVLKYYNKKEGVTVFNNPKNIAQKFSQSLVSFKKRMFLARRFMPIFMRNALEQRDANIAARLHEATRLTNTFTKMYEAYNGNKSELIRNFDAHLRGDYSVDLPVEFAELSNDMRNEIKSLQNELLAAGLLDISDVMKYENDFGMYLTRSYEVFDKKNYKKKIMKDLNSETYIKAMNVIRKQMTETAKQEAITKNIPFEEALDNLSKNKLEDYLTKNDSEEYRSSKGREGSKDLSILKQRLDIPYEIRMLMGEYSDPGQNFARTVMSMTSLVANNKYLNDLKTLGEGKFFFSANDARKPITHNTLIAPKGSETFNPMNGMYTTPEIAEEFNKVASQSSDAMKTYMKVLSTVKWLKTIASVATHAKNVTSNIFLLIANGHINPKTIGQAYKDLRLDIHPEGNKIRRTFGLKPSKKAIERSHEKIKEYISAGVIKQSAGIGEIRDMFKDADFDTAFASRVNKDKLTAYDKMKKKGVQAKNFAEQLYEAEDDFFKIVAYESEMSRYSKAMFGKNKKNLTEEEYAQLKEKVAEIVKNTFPTYSRVPGIVQMVRKSPIIGTFVAFQAESYRTAYNTMALGFKELSSANIEERKIGIQRILGIGAYKSLSVALTSYFGVAIGTGMTGILGKILDTEDEEEKEKQMRLFVPEWSKDSDLMSLSLKDGVYTFIDQSASDPHGGINRAVNAFMKGGKEGFAEGFYSIVEPFIRPEMTASVLMGLYNNQDAYGERIYNKEADFSTIANEVGAYLYKWVEPGTASSVRKIIKADDKGVEGVGQMTGFKPMKIDIGKQFFFKMKDMRDRLDDIKDIYNDEYSSKDATSKTIADKYEEANRKYEAAQEEIAKYYNAAVQLGSFSNPAKAAEYKRNLIRSVTETAGVSKFSAGRVLNNQKMPLKKRFDKIER